MKEFYPIKTSVIPLSLIDENEGQIDGVPANPRFITDEKFEDLKKSITDDPEFMSLNPLKVYPLNGRYVAIGGNMRRKAMEELGYDHVPCIVFSEDTPPDVLKARIMKDNYGYGEWDKTMLAEDWDMADLESWGMDDLIDFNVEDNVGGDEPPKDVEINEGNVETRVKKGDVWVLGNHRLMCGDSTDPNDVAVLMDGEKADLCFTDPPYGVAIGDKNKVKNDGGITENIMNDTLGNEELGNLLVAAFNNIRENCKDDASYYVTSPQGGDMLLFMQSMKDAGLPVRHILIWLKNKATFSMCRLDYDYQHEPILYTWTKSHHCYKNGEFRTSVWEYEKVMKCALHPTMKPIPLVINCIKDSTKEKDLIIDLFGGSGTTIMAAEETKRRCNMMELDPHYCDVILARWEEATGKEAVKVL